MRFSCTTLLLTVALVLVPTFAAADQKPSRNILLIIGDDHGLDGGCFGNPDVPTPNFDRLAGQGTRFVNAFAAVSSCSPSRSVILTGLYNHTSGQYGLAHASNNQVTEPWVQSLPRLLNDAGYRTILIGKNHVQPKAVYPYQSELDLSRSPADAAAKAAAVFASTDERPLFLVVGFHDPHRAKTGFGNDAAEPPLRIDPDKIRVPPFLPDKPDVRKDLAAYYEAVARLDSGVGMVLDALEKSGKSDSTLIIYVGDNGIPFPGAKTTLYDAGVHLPMLVRAPGSRGGVVSKAMVSFVDITPTVLDWANVKLPQPLPGRSLLPLLEREAASDRDAVFASHTCHEVWMYYPMRMIRTRTHKLIWNLAHELPWPVASDIYPSPSWKTIERTREMGSLSFEQYVHRPEFELFDLEKDPNELHNLTDDSAHAPVKSELLARLREMMKTTNDPWLVMLAHREKTEK